MYTLSCTLWHFLPFSSLSFSLTLSPVSRSISLTSCSSTRLRNVHSGPVYMAFFQVNGGDLGRINTGTPNIASSSAGLYPCGVCRNVEA